MPKARGSRSALLGQGVTGLLRRGNRVVGVTARHVDCEVLQLRARLVMGADGYRSKTAELAGAAERTYPNSRAFLYAYCRDVPWRIDGEAAVWWYGESTAATLLAGESVDKALGSYRRLERGFFFMRSDAAAGTANPVQRPLREAAVHEPVTSERLLQVGMQVAPTTSLLRPSVIARAWNLRRRARRTAATQNRQAAPAAVA